MTFILSVVVLCIVLVFDSSGVVILVHGAAYLGIFLARER
jgi:hypothetical protein